MEGHVDHLLSSCGSSLYALSLLRAHGMQAIELQEIFRSKVLSRLMYASQAWWGFAQSQRDSGMETTSHTIYRIQTSSTRANVLVTALSHLNLSLLCVNRRMIICSDKLFQMRIMFFIISSQKPKLTIIMCAFAHIISNFPLRTTEILLIDAFSKV